jgi:hypothetical protein
VRYGQGPSYEGLLADLAAQVPDPAIRARVLGANALELFHFPTAQQS